MAEIEETSCPEADDGFLSGNDASPPTSICANERDVRAEFEGEVSTLDSQGTSCTLPSAQIVVEQPPLPPNIPVKPVPLRAGKVIKPYAEPNWSNVKKSVVDKYATERKRADSATEEAQWQNKELNKQRVEALEYVKASQTFMRASNKKLGSVAKKNIDHGINLKLQKKEIIDLKKQVTKLEGRLKAKKDEQDSVLLARIKDRDEKIATLQKEVKDTTARNRSEMGEWKASYTEHIKNDIEMANELARLKGGGVGEDDTGGG